MSDLSIIIVTYNSSEYIVACLHTIYRQNTSFNFEVILFDNNSSDSTVSLIQNSFKQVVLLTSVSNIGFAAANNEAAIHSNSNVLFFLNPDTKLGDGSLNSLYNVMCEHKDEKIIMAPMQLSYDTGTFLNCGLGLDIFGFPINEGLGKKFFYADGAAIFIKKKHFMELGMFDEKLFLIQEDVDLSWKARLLGYQILRVENAVVFHKSGHSIGTGSSSTKVISTSIYRRYHGEKNSIRNIIKNYSFHNLLWVLPITAAIGFAEIVMFVLIGKPRVSWAYIRATYWNMYNMPNTLIKRKWIQSQRKVNDFSIMKNMYKGSAKLNLLLDAGIPHIK